MIKKKQTTYKAAIKQQWPQESIVKDLAIYR